jgi:hypothetical protein
MTYNPHASLTLSTIIKAYKDKKKEELKPSVVLTKWEVRDKLLLLVFEVSDTGTTFITTWMNSFSK